jgi:hypothetical protein
MVRHAEIMRQHMAKINEADDPNVIHIMATYFDVSKWIINHEGKIDVKGDCTMKPSAFATPGGKFLIAFGEITGDFIAIDCKLRSLKGAPSRVGGGFTCGGNKLTSLIGAPSHVDGSFICVKNNLTDLKGGPKFVGGNYDCTHNPIRSLEGLPDELPAGDFAITWHAELPMLRLVGKTIYILADRAIKGPIEDIINEYWDQPTRANIIECQKRLIDAGFAGNAAW